jgi:hypothetical protein
MSQWPVEQTITIRELVLRVSGLDPVDARQLAEEVGEIVTRRLGVQPLYDVPSVIAISTRVPPEITRSELAGAIAQRIVESLQ